MRPRRAGAVAALELRSAVSGALFWGLVLLAVLAGTALNVTTFTSAGRAVRPWVNSQHAMAWLFAMSGFLVYVFFTCVLAGLATLRDDEHRVSELLHSSGLRRREYLGGKLAGVLAAVGLALALHLLATVLFFQLVPLDAGLGRGPFRLTSYLLPALLFPLPLVCYCAGLAFAAGVRTRRPTAVFAVPVALLFAVAWLMSWTPDGLGPGGDRLLMVLDPSGLRWLLRTVLSVDRGVEFYNTAPLPLDGVFLANRLWTLAVALLAVAWAMARRRTAGRATPTRRRRGAAPPPAAAATTPADLPTMGRTRPGVLPTALRVAGAELWELAGQPALYLFVLLAMAVVWDGATSARGTVGAAVIPTAGHLAMETLPVLALLACLVLLFSVVHALARERAEGVAPLVHATPVSTRALLLGKGIAQLGVVAALLAGCSAVVCLLLARGPAPVDPRPLGLAWGLLLLPTLALWIAFLTALNTLVRDTAATWVLGLAALGLSLYHLRTDGATWVINWTLLGSLRWSDMGPFALDGRPLVLNRLLAVSTALLLAAVAVRFFPRVETDGAAAWYRLRPRRWWRTAVALAPFAVLPALLAAHLAAGVGDGFKGDTAERWPREYRHHNLTTWSGREAPHVTALDLTIDLQPAARRADVAGTYTLVNPTGEPMRRLPFTVGPDFADVGWRVGGAPVPFDDRSGLHVLRPAAPLEPGREVRVGFSYRLVRPRGYSRNGGGTGQFVLPSGVLLHTLRDSFLPRPGFDASIGAEAYRPAQPPPDFWRAELGPGAGSPVPFASRVAVTAPAGYTVNGPGRKVAESTRDGRTTVVWQTAHPVRAVSLVAGRWQVRRRPGAAVYFHPGHPYNVDEILDALTAARRHYSRWFHPYPWDELRLSEFPNLSTNALGFATNVSFSETIGFLAARDGSHAPFVVTAHEAAHQWWGNLLAPAAGPGTGHLVEGMAHHSALLLVEAEHGEAARRELARRMERNYVERRRAATELPLLEMVNDERPSEWTVVYEKGAWVSWMLQEHLGRERFFAGLRSFIGRHLDGPDHPTTHDLIEHLRSTAPDVAAYDCFVDQWFRRVVLPEYRVGGVTVSPLEGGWKVTATVENVGTGSMPVEVAVSGAGGEERRSVHPPPGKPAELVVEVGFAPERVVVDPGVEVLQRGREGAVVEL